MLWGVKKEIPWTHGQIEWGETIEAELFLKSDFSWDQRILQTESSSVQQHTPFPDEK